MQKTRSEIAREHGTLVLGASFTPELMDYFRTTTKFGLGFDIAWLSCSVIAESGRKFRAFRAYQAISTPHRYSGEIDAADNAGSGFGDGYVGYLDFEIVPGEDRILIRSHPGKHSFRIEIEAGRIHWVEDDGAIDVVFEAQNPAFLFVSPGGTICSEVAHSYEWFKVSGTMLGESVKGQGSLVQSWGPPGVSWRQDKVYRILENFIMPFGNLYPDGSLEYGVFLFGEGEFNIGFFGKDGKGYVSNDSTIDVEWAEGGYPKTADIRIGEHRFKWVSSDLIPPPTGRIGCMHYIAGQMINQGHSASPTQDSGWIEYRPRQMQSDIYHWLDWSPAGKS